MLDWHSCQICYPFEIKLLLSSLLSFLFTLLSELFEPRHEKTCLCHMRTTKAQISLRIRAVGSALVLFAAGEYNTSTCYTRTS